MNIINCVLINHFFFLLYTMEKKKEKKNKLGSSHNNLYDKIFLTQKYLPLNYLRKVKSIRDLYQLIYDRKMCTMTLQEGKCAKMDCFPLNLELNP